MKMGSRMMTKLLRGKFHRLTVGIFLTFFLIFIIDLSGVFRHLREKSFETEFSYPLESPVFMDIVETFRKGKDIHIPPINNLYSSFNIHTELTDMCAESNTNIPLIILVKSAPSNFKQRKAIRETWMASATELNAKTVFFIGNSKLTNYVENEAVEKSLSEEEESNSDIVRLEFLDSYYNNTIKTMLEMRWAVEMCPNFDYALLIDDDYFLSVKNLIKFVQTPLEYPSIDIEKMSPNYSDTMKLYAGYRMFPPPHRHKLLTKWFVPLDEYPYDYFPPYITAGAILLSKNALFDIYYASFYTTHFRFDDVYVAICAKKMNITPVNSEYFRFWSTRDESPEEYLIASHGFSKPERLVRFWNIQKSHGYC